MNIEIIVACYGYERRFAWFLSSLLQQHYLPDVTINLAYVPGTGTPSIDRLIDFYSKNGIKFNLMACHEVEDMAYRGELRNWQIETSHGDWLLFYDIDHILPPDYFLKLRDYLNRATNTQKLFYESNKHFTDPEKTQKIIDGQGGKKYIKRAYYKAISIKDYDYKGRGVAGGCFMLVNRLFLYETTGGLYCEEHKCKDKHMFKQRTWSDIQFKKNFKKRKLNLGELVHLGHPTWKNNKDNWEEIQK